MRRGRKREEGKKVRRRSFWIEKIVLSVSKLKFSQKKLKLKNDDEKILNEKIETKFYEKLNCEKIKKKYEQFHHVLARRQTKSISYGYC